MSAEQLAKRIVQTNLGRECVINDDGTSDGMYDLRIGPAGAPELAIEVTGAVNKTYTETWNVGPASGAMQSLDGLAWIVEISDRCHVKTLRTKLPDLLDQASNIHLWRSVQVADNEEHHLLMQAIEDVGVIWFVHVPDSKSGKIHLTMRGDGGAVNTNGTGISQWIAEFVANAGRNDNVEKLRKANAKSCEVFIILSSHGGPWIVASYFFDQSNDLPTQIPDLVAPIEGVWLVDPVWKTGVRYTSGEWKRLAWFQ